MALEGTPAEATRRLEAAWAARTDNYHAAIAAHVLARHQETPLATLYWDKLAVQHAVAVTDGRAAPFMASLYLNLAAAHASVGERGAAATSVGQSLSCWWPPAPQLMRISLGSKNPEASDGYRSRY
jgi:hypothetical protein